MIVHDSNGQPYEADLVPGPQYREMVAALRKCRRWLPSHGTWAEDNLFDIDDLLHRSEEALRAEAGEPSEGTEFVDMATGRTMLLKTSGEWGGWLFWKHPDGQWVSLRKATDEDRAAIIAARREVPNG